MMKTGKFMPCEHKTSGKKAIFLYGLTFVFTFFGTLSLAQTENLATAVRTSIQISVDGRLSEEPWHRAQKIDGFTQKDPQEGELASEQTEVRIVYDDKYLYLGIICFDSQADKIVANEMRRDGELKDNDYFEIYIDSFHDHRNAFYFAINPLGARRDGLIRDEGSSINWDWDGIWLTRVIRLKNCWTAEVAIPFYTLRFENHKNMNWGINFGRHIARKREESYWSPILRDYGRQGKYKVSFFGHLSGLDDLKSGKRVQIMPYVIGGGTQGEGEDSLSQSGDMGLDLKYRLTPNLTADITVNTDFAQVEADQEQFNLTRFSLFFPEKRGFFLEGADIFRIGERYREFQPPSALLFFSRTIGLSEDGKEIPVIGGMRMTGKAGRYDLGVLELLTDRTSYIEDDERIDVERTIYSVFRLKRDIFNKSTFGLMFLSKNSLDSSAFNGGAGFDFNLAFGQSVKMMGFAAKTFTPGIIGKDLAAYMDFIYESDTLKVDVAYTDIGENFNAEMGFIPRLDIRKVRGNVTYGFRPNILNTRKFHLFNRLTYIETHSGQIESRDNMTGIWNTFQNGSYLFVGYIQNYEHLVQSFEIKKDVLIPEGIHKFNQMTASYESDKSRRFALHAETSFGQFYNGRLFRVGANSFFKINSHFNLEFILDRNQFNLPVDGGEFTTYIAATRIIYSFTPDLFTKAYLQWNDSEKLFKSNFLIRWIYKPGANLYLIYNETRELGTQRHLQDRVLMIKVSFLF